MVGTVTIEIQIAPANILMLGAANVDGGVTAADNTNSKTEVGRAVIGADIGARADPLAAETADFTLTNIEFRCVRYHMSPEFDFIIANLLKYGKKY